MTKFPRRNLHEESKILKMIMEVFTYPNIEDICAVHDLNDVVAALSDPQISRRGHFIFNLDFDKYNIQ